MKCHLTWGTHGADVAAGRGDIVVIIDVLSFSTTVATAVGAGAVVFPCADKRGATMYARSIGAEEAVSRHEVPAKGRFSLSPLTFSKVERGAKIVLPSPNGARCSLAAAKAPIIVAGAFVNSRAVADYALDEAISRGCDISLMACGEMLTPYGKDLSIRFALEDLLGAGAIAAHLNCDKSPEARAAESAFLAVKDGLRNVLFECESGHELLEMGYPQDIEFAARVGISKTVPVFNGHSYIADEK